MAAFVFIAFPAHAEDPSIVDIATSNPDFSSLVDALVSQDLVGTLQGPGPFTVFAPTNEAFDKLPNYVGRALQKNPDLLTKILLAHVVPGSLTASDVVSNRTLDTAGGNTVRVRSFGDRVYVHLSRVTATDIIASNGVVHVIDRVIIPRDLRREIIRALVSSYRSH